MREQIKEKEIEIKNFKTSKEFAKKLLEVLLEEEPNKRYKYIIEKLKDGRKIYLKRPTRRYNFDFEIYVEKWDGKSDKRPSHKEIIDYLIKSRKNPQLFEKLWKGVQGVFKFGDPEKLVSQLGLEKEPDAEMILKVLKWMFGLEDIYYWNFKRRNRLMDALKKEVFQQDLVNLVHNQK